MPSCSRLLVALIIVASSHQAYSAESDTQANVPVVESRKVSHNQCGDSDNNHLQKSLLLTAFPRLSPTSSNAGNLAEAEHLVPELLGQQLLLKHNTLVPAQLAEALQAPGASSDQLLAQQIQQLARAQHTQLVLRGEIVDMSMAHPEATYHPDLYTRVTNSLYDLTGFKTGFDKRDRLFSLELDLHDGFTGQRLFSKRYNTYGLWNETRATGFGSPLFWQTDYGEQIQGLIKRAARDLSEVVQCQPFIALIDARPGQPQILLQGGANNGLRTGDTLNLYQLIVQGSETNYEQHQVRLVNRDTAIELREVYPSHSVGVIKGTNYLTGQFLAVAP